MYNPRNKGLKKLLASTLVFTMMMGAGTTALAKDGRNNNDRDDGGNKGNTQSNNGRFQGEAKLDFKDLQDKKFEWALRYIADLAARRVFEGYSDGSFRPQETVTRIEAITAAVRVMGLRDKAESAAEMQTKLNFKDAGQVPSWAVGYVAVAAENDLFAESDTKVNPNQPADRLWATTLLVKALKLQSEAEANMNAKLPFKDADNIPAGSFGYVKVAIDKGLVNGFEDNTFRPNQPVTRAEIAALLDRAGNYLPGNEDGLVVGTISAAVSNNVLTISSSGQTSSLTLDANVFIYRNGTKINASQLQVGDAIKARVFNSRAIFIEVTQTSGTNPVPTPSNGVHTGTLAAAINGNAMSMIEGGSTIALTLHSNALFFRNGAQVSAASLQVGDVIRSRSYTNAVVFVEVTQPAGSSPSPTEYDRVLEGTVSAPVSNNVLTIVSNGQTYTLSLNGGAFFYRGGAASTASSLQAGDTVTTYSYNNSTAIVEVTQAVISPAASTGQLTGTVATPINNNTLAIRSGDKTYGVTFNANAFVYRSGVQTRSTALQAGDVVTVHYYNGVVLYAEVSQLAGGASSQLPTIGQQSGSIVSVINNVLTLISGNQTATLTLNSNAFIYRGGALVRADALQAGDVVNTRSYNNTVIYAEVTQLSNGSGQSFVVTGTLNGTTLNNQGEIASISINQTNTSGSAQTVVYSVSPNVTINGNTANLVQNRPIVLQGSGQLVTAIYIQ